MKPVIIDRNSLAYKFSNLLLNYPNDPKDICQFRRMLILAALRVMGLVASVFITVFSITGTIVHSISVGNISWIGSGKLDELGAILYIQAFISGMIIVFSMIAGITALFICAIEWIKNRSYPNKVEGPLKRAYTSWRDKVCYPVKVSEVSDENQS